MTGGDKTRTQSQFKYILYLSLYIREYIKKTPSCFLLHSQRKSATENRTSVTTWTWTLTAARAALVCHDIQPAALALKLMDVNTASLQTWPPWRRRVSSTERSVSSQQQITAAPAAVT